MNRLFIAGAVSTLLSIGGSFEAHADLFFTEITKMEGKNTGGFEQTTQVWLTKDRRKSVQSVGAMGQTMTTQEWILLDKEQWARSKHSGKLEVSSFKDLIAKEKDDQARKDAFKGFAGPLGGNATVQEFAVLADETGEEKTVDGVPCKLVVLDAKVKLSGPGIDPKLVGKKISAFKMEIWYAPKLAAAAQEFFSFEDALQKKLGRVTMDGKSQLDFLYQNAREGKAWAQEMVKKMQSIKGFPLQRRFSVDVFGEESQEIASDALDDVLDGKNPQVKAQLDAGRADALKRREAALANPAKRSELIAQASGAYQRSGLPVADAEPDVDRFLKDPKYYDVLMAKMMGMARKSIQKQTKSIGKEYGFGTLQTISKLATDKIPPASLEIPDAKKK